MPFASTSSAVVTRAVDLLAAAGVRTVFMPSAAMSANNGPPLTDEKRALRELAEEAGTSDDPAAFDKVTTPEQNGVRAGTAEKPKPN